jgi:hypothetical protein
LKNKPARDFRASSGKRSPLYKAKRKIEKAKAQVRAKVEHPFRVIKRQFGYTKVRFRGLAKNTAQLVTLFALSICGWRGDSYSRTQERCACNTANSLYEARVAAKSPT